MKDTFFNLNDVKQKRIIEATLKEFALSGYEKTSMDMIVHRAGVSKGGMYEYIASKEDLFQYALEHSYGSMFSFIQDRIKRDAVALPADPLERTRFISAVAVEFYIENPVTIAFIVSASQVCQVEIRDRVTAVLDTYFENLYRTCRFDEIVYDGPDVLSLLKWLLIKTRNDFQEKMEAVADVAVCRESYLAEWRFFLSALSSGIYGGGKRPSA